jgi:hypothetical protein
MICRSTAIPTSLINVATPWSLDVANATSTGVTTDGINIWTVDPSGALVFKYYKLETSVFSFVLDAANAGATGITTDGTSFWIVDDGVYKYTLAGALESSFGLTFGNSNPTGITTNGSQIWVIDADLKIYSYRIDDVYISTGGISLTGPTRTHRGSRHASSKSLCTCIASPSRTASVVFR